MCNEFFKMQKAMLGGTRTVQAVPEPVRVVRQSPYVPAPQKSELWPEPKPLRNEAPDRRKEHLIALGRAGLEVDMFRVLDVFPSFNAYQEAVNG
jgi:hypothetical protein